MCVCVCAFTQLWKQSDLVHKSRQTGQKKKAKIVIANTIEEVRNSIVRLGEQHCRPLQTINKAKVKHTQAHTHKSVFFSSRHYRQGRARWQPWNTSIVYSQRKVMNETNLIVVLVTQHPESKWVSTVNHKETTGWIPLDLEPVKSERQEGVFKHFNHQHSQYLNSKSASFEGLFEAPSLCRIQLNRLSGEQIQKANSSPKVLVAPVRFSRHHRVDNCQPFKNF